MTNAATKPYCEGGTGTCEVCVGSCGIEEYEATNAADVQEKALAHIKRCDELFDGNVVRPDKEFAYQQLRVLTLELLEKVVEA